MCHELPVEIRTNRELTFPEGVESAEGALVPKVRSIVALAPLPLALTTGQLRSSKVEHFKP